MAELWNEERDSEKGSAIHICEQRGHQKHLLTFYEKKKKNYPKILYKPLPNTKNESLSPGAS